VNCCFEFVTWVFCSCLHVSQEADSDGNGTLDLEEFKDVITNLFHFKFKVCLKKEGLLYSGGLAVEANFKCQFAVTFVIMWRFTVRKLSCGCGKL